MPGIGKASLEETIGNMVFVEKSGADFVFLHPDTYTRKSQFHLAKRGMEQSIEAGHSMLNGCPYVNYGVKSGRKIIESLGIPLAFNGAADEEPMLLAEIGLAFGCTMNATHDLHQLLQHSKNYPLENMIQNMQYINRLTGYYEEHGCPIEVMGLSNLNSYFVPSIGGAIQLISCLTAVEQGVKHFSFSFGLSDCLIQDVATFRGILDLAKEYLKRFGYHDVTLSLSCWPWMGAWPREEYRAAGLVGWNAAIAAMVPLDWMYVKAVDEAFAVPTQEGNAAAVRITKQTALSLKGQVLQPSSALALEEDMFKKEVRAIVDRVIELGDGDVIVGEIKAVERGELDVPFPCWTRVPGNVLPIRDAQGAQRYFSTGNLPLPKESIEYHRQKIAEREKLEGRKADIDMVVQDLFWFSKDLPLIGNA